VNRLDRLSAILIQLQSKKVVTAREIANRFEISLRTVYRDIRTLEEAGVPVGAEAGIGYFLNPGYHLPPVMFTNEEASAFILAEKLIEKMTDSKVDKVFESALFKVKSVLKVSEKEFLENLNSKIAVFSADQYCNNASNLNLTDIQTALANKILIDIEYTANYNGQCTKRIIEPLSLCFYGMQWHLIAFCKLRGDYRDFRLDRINKLSLLKYHYCDKHHLTLNEYFDKISKENSLYAIQIRVRKELMTSIEGSKYWFGLISEEKIGDYYQMRFSNSNLNVFAKWILSMGDKVEIVAPHELKIKVKECVDELYGFYF
jgi:predicted DNA-binding transcriptional regulator YafY